MATDTPHSAEYFGEQRDFWWNLDFLQLMARRWLLPEAPRMLDVGCGIGHWGRLMLSLVSDRATLVGLDREAKWVAEAAARAAKRGLSVMRVPCAIQFTPVTTLEVKISVGSSCRNDCPA